MHTYLHVLYGLSIDNVFTQLNALTVAGGFDFSQVFPVFDPKMQFVTMTCWFVPTLLLCEVPPGIRSGSADPLCAPAAAASAPLVSASRPSRDASRAATMRCDGWCR